MGVDESKVEKCINHKSKLKQLYKKLDKDGNGFLDQYELALVCKDLDIPQNYASLGICLTCAGNTKINVEEFRDFLNLLLINKRDHPKFVNIVFNRFDQDKNGYLDKNEIRSYIRSLNFIYLNDPQIEAIFKAADLNKNDKISKTEFTGLVAQLEAAMLENGL